MIGFLGLRCKDCAAIQKCSPWSPLRPLLFLFLFLVFLLVGDWSESRVLDEITFKIRMKVRRRKE